MKKYFYPTILVCTTLICIQSFSQNTFPSSGNVGIGTTSPANLFEVSGAIPSLGGSLSVISTTGSNHGLGLALNATGSGNNNLGFQVNGTNKTTFAWDNSRNFFGIANLVYSPNDFSLRIHSDGSYTYNNGSSGNELFRITSSGNVGIGTATPDAKLQVIGNADIGDGTDPTKYGFLQLARPANQGDYKFHLSFVRNGNSVSGMGYALNSNVLGIWHSNNNAGTPTMAFTYDQKVGIGTATPQATLAVNGDIYAKKVKVTQTGWPDYVFSPGYKLRPLSEVELFIQQQQHLPEVPSAAEVEKDGIDLGDNQAILLKKIEELTLYIISLNKDVEALKKDMSQLKATQN